MTPKQSMTRSGRRFERREIKHSRNFLPSSRASEPYSLFNAMLIRVQRPGALAVASRRRWQEFGRIVAPDAVPIVILQPFGPVQFVYDVLRDRTASLQVCADF